MTGTDKNGRRLAVMALLLVGIGACLLLLPWQKWFGDAPTPQTQETAFGPEVEARLRERITTYTELREKNDWPRMYEIMDPKHREVVDLVAFLKYYGHGFVRVREMTLAGCEVNKKYKKARVILNTKLEVIPEKLPAQYRKGLRLDDPDSLRKDSELELIWSWRDGDWYLAMDRTILTGRDEEGNDIGAIGR